MLRSWRECRWHETEVATILRSLRFQQHTALCECCRDFHCKSQDFETSFAAIYQPVIGLLFDISRLTTSKTSSPGDAMTPDLLSFANKIFESIEGLQLPTGLRSKLTQRLSDEIAASLHRCRSSVVAADYFFWSQCDGLEELKSNELRENKHDGAIHQSKPRRRTKKHRHPCISNILCRCLGVYVEDDLDDDDASISGMKAPPQQPPGGQPNQAFERRRRVQKYVLQALQTNEIRDTDLAETLHLVRSQSFDQWIAASIIHDKVRLASPVHNEKLIDDISQQMLKVVLGVSSLTRADTTIRSLGSLIRSFKKRKS
jgi:hypothetical protein